VLGVLDSQEAALQRLVKNTGVTFAALTENEQQLQTLITSSQRVFEATGSRNDALAE
jgi:ABC-type transporter Mla subunit MlaD